jgi:hypothetical protein
MNYLLYMPKIMLHNIDTSILRMHWLSQVKCRKKLLFDGTFNDQSSLRNLLLTRWGGGVNKENTLCASPNPRLGFPTSYVAVLFCVQWNKVRGDCSFYWYWWNCWTPLFNKKKIMGSFDLKPQSIDHVMDRYIYQCTSIPKLGKFTILYIRK